MLLRWTGAKKRYPLRATVSMYRGFSALSERAERSLFTAVLMLRSNSTTVPLGQPGF